MRRPLREKGNRQTDRQRGSESEVRRRQMARQEENKRRETVQGQEESEQVQREGDQRDKGGVMTEDEGCTSSREEG